MPTAKPAPPAAGVPDRSTPTTRAGAPASEGLPPSRRSLPSSTKRRRAHPARAKGRSRVETAEALVQATKAVIEEGATPAEAAVEAGLEATGASVKMSVKTARQMFVDNVGFYLAAHAHATKIAAESGDAKPAQWALERIADAGERVFDSPEAQQAKPPSLNIGIRIGGIPQPALPQVADQPVEAAVLTTADLPQIESGTGSRKVDVPEELMP